MGRISSNWLEERVRNAVEKSNTISEVLLRLNLNPKGNYRTFHKYIRLYSIDTSHFYSENERLKIARSYSKITNLDDILVKDSFYAPKTLKKRLINDGYFEYKCSECGIKEWNNKPINLQMDHINGDKFDNRLENLRLLCPNCHSQTETFCGKTNNKSKYVKCKCGNEMYYSSTCCKKCAENSKKTKINWPRIEWLEKETEKRGFAAVGRELGVSDNAVRKRIRKFKKLEK